MKKYNPTKTKAKISILLLVISILLVAGIVVKGANYMAFSAKVPGLIAEATEHSKPDPNETKKYSEKAKELTDELTKKNMFAPPPPKPQNPIKEINIIGDTVLIDGNLYKEGADCKGAKILRIEASQMTYEWQGEKITIGPFGTISSGSDDKKDEKKRRRGKREEKVEENNQPREENSERRRRGPRGGRGRRREMSEEEREKISNMSREERREYFRSRREERSGDNNE
ncbi:MAG: hypothetical protein ACYSWP_07310 [Planctomycetota bacterium]|jgi:hypothetical protein